MKKILVPCDFSAPAEEAFKFAVRIAQQNKGEIHVLHVLDITFVHGNPTLSYSYAFNVNFIKDMENEAKEKFKLLWAKHSPFTLPVKFHHCLGSLVPDVEKYIHDNGIDLVIMGTHGSDHALHGTNTEKVVRHSSVPVLAIRTAPDKAIKNIILPVIPDQRCGKLIDQVKELQRFYAAHVSLLWINTPQFFKTDLDINRELDQFAREHDLENYSIHTRSDYDVESGIFHFAREMNGDLIALGTHARKGVTHLFTGSIAEDIVSHSTLPTWTCSME